MSATISATGLTIPEDEALDAAAIAAVPPAPAVATTADDDMQYEPVVEKWSRKTRLAFIAAATAGLWFAVSRLWG